MCCSREERCTGARSRVHCSKDGGMCCNKEKLGGIVRKEEECTIAKIQRNVVLQRGMMCSSREERCTEVRRRGSKEELEGYCRKEEECTIAMIQRNRLLQRGRMCCSREERCTGARSRMHCS